MPLVSVVIPVYNAEKDMSRSIDSVLGQTFKDFELILVDDGSKDNSGHICDEYKSKDDRIRVIHQTNKGRSEARNAGIEAASGKYIYFVDSDDYVESNLLEKCFLAITENKTDAVCINRFVEGHKATPKLFTEKKNFDIKSSESKLSFITEILFQYKVGWEPWSWFFKSDIIKNNEIQFPDDKLIFAEDKFFITLYALKAESVYYIPDRLYHYVIRTDSVMSTAPKKMINTDINFSSLLFQKISDKYLLENYCLIHHFIFYFFFESAYEKRDIKHYDSFISEIIELDNAEFFFTQNKRYFKKNYWKYIKKNGFLFGIKKKIIDRFLSDVNESRFRFFLRIWFFVSKIISKIH